MENTTNGNENTNIVSKLSNEQIRSMSTPDLLMRIFEELHQVKKEHPRAYEAYKEELKKWLIENQMCDTSITGKDKTIWQALNEAVDEDVLYAMEAIKDIGIFLDCRAEFELYEYKEALKGWQHLNFMFNHEAIDRIKEYADKIESK